MKIEEMSNKELLSYFGSITYVSGLNDTRDDTSDMYEKELLSRLEQGEKAIAKLNKVKRIIDESIYPDDVVGRLVASIFRE